MSADSSTSNRSAWRTALPILKGPTVTLREPRPEDVGPVVDLLATSDGSRFGLDDGATGDLAAAQLIDRARAERSQGHSFTYLVALTSAPQVVGLIQVRSLDPVFETAEWEATMMPSARGTGLFMEAARLVGAFTFGTLGANRIESRVLLQNGRGNGALRKLGAVQEGVLRRAIRQHGRYFDVVLWSLLKEDWGHPWMSAAPRVH
jgi:RimJ/RimL family protein N-acetyltransferase